MGNTLQESHQPSPSLSKQDSNFLIQLLMDLSTTIFQPFLTNSGKLRPTFITSLWQACQKLCRSNFSEHVSPPTKPTPKIQSFLEAAKLPGTPSTTKLRQTTPFPANTDNPYHHSKPPSTPKTNNQTSPQLATRKHHERYNMKLYINPTSTNPIQGFVHRIKTWFEH